MAAKALKACFPATIPVMAGYLGLGIAYGILMVTSGFPVWVPVLTAAVVYTGSMEYLLVSILLSSFHPLSCFLTAVMVGSRHLFYGLSMLDRYRGAGWKKFYLIYACSDETFALNYSARIPDGVDHDWYYFWVTLLDQCYWIAGALIGAVCGSLITFNTRGLDFMMTALFLTIFMDQWVKDGTKMRTMLIDHAPELVGVIGSLVCRLIFGADGFLIPSMIVIVCALTLLRPKLENRVLGEPDGAGDGTGSVREQDHPGNKETVNTEESGS